MGDRTVLKIGELAEISGLSVRTLRGYEGLGIITPLRSEGGTRLYRADDVIVAQAVNRMRELDIPVDTIRAIATKRRDYETGDQSSSAMMEILDDLSDVLSERTVKTFALRDELTKTVRLLQGCQGCRNKPSPKTCPDCPMETNPDRTDIARMIWQAD